MDKSKVGGQFSGSLRLCHSENKLPKKFVCLFWSPTKCHKKWG